MGADDLELPVSLIQARELVLTGVFRYANTWPTAIALAADGRVDLDGLVTGRFPLDRAEVVEAFTLTQEGERSPLAGAVTNVRAASFPSAPQARAVTVTAVRANGPTADRPGQLER